MVPIDSPWVVSYSTSTDPMVVSSCHRFRHIWRVISMTLNCEGSRSSNVTGHGPSRKPMVGFLSDILAVQHPISHRFLRQTDSLTDSLTDRQTDFIIGPMLLMHCADKSKKRDNMWRSDVVHVKEKYVFHNCHHSHARQSTKLYTCWP